MICFATRTCSHFHFFCSFGTWKKAKWTEFFFDRRHTNIIELVRLHHNRDILTHDDEDLIRNFSSILHSIPAEGRPSKKAISFVVWKTSKVLIKYWNNLQHIMPHTLRWQMVFMKKGHFPILHKKLEINFYGSLIESFQHLILTFFYKSLKTTSGQQLAI